MGAIINTAFHYEFAYLVAALLHSSLRTEHHGLGLKERRGFWNLEYKVAAQSP